MNLTPILAFGAMAAELIWSSESLDDTDAIAQFIGRDSLHHAQRVVEGLFELGEMVVAHPWPAASFPSWATLWCASASCTATG